MITVVFGNHKFGKIRPKFLSIIRHFLKFVEDSQVLQVCCNVAHFLQNSDNIFTGFELFGKKFSQKMRCVIFHLWAFERKFRSKVRSRFFLFFVGLFWILSVFLQNVNLKRDYSNIIVYSLCSGRQIPRFSK